MSKSIIFSFPGYEAIAAKIKEQLDLEAGDVTVRHFPDGESFVKLNTSVKNKKIVLVCGLDNPDQKAMALVFFADLAREPGGKGVEYILASEHAALIREAEARGMERAAEICEVIRTGIANGPMPEGARFDYEQAIRAAKATP
jgi:hypothetical protein